MCVFWWLGGYEYEFKANNHVQILFTYILSYFYRLVP
jgi:hypothetical protein